MAKIEVDDEIFEFLQTHAIPLLDSPNDVLRRLLLSKESKQGGLKNMRNSTIAVAGVSEEPEAGFPTSNAGFVRFVLRTEFDERFVAASGFRMTFESDSRVANFHNFNKSGRKSLWYRIEERHLAKMRSSDKSATVFFTVPAEKCAYVIPLEDIEQRIRYKKWTRNDIEVNIDHASSRWRELDWDIKEYFRQY